MIRETVFSLFEVEIRIPQIALVIVKVLRLNHVLRFHSRLIHEIACSFEIVISHSRYIEQTFIDTVFDTIVIKLNFGSVHLNLRI